MNKKRSILLVQFRTDASYLHERMCYYAKILNKNDIELSIINAFDEDVNWSDPESVLNGYSGVILGGSGEFHFPGKKNGRERKLHEKMLRHMRPFVSYLVEKDFPTLGICFGHQLIGYILGSRVVHDEEQAKTGSYDVELNMNAIDDPLYKDVPGLFKAQYAHKDSLIKAPKGSVLQACGKNCRVSAFRYKENIYSVQFHPEMSIKDMFFRMKLFKEYVAGSDVPIEKRFAPTTFSQKILRNFILYVALPEKIFKTSSQYHEKP